jgi:hypothetical protein
VFSGGLGGAIAKGGRHLQEPFGSPSIVQELRVTQLFRRESGQWRIVHRHADSQVTKQTIG